VMLMPKAFPVDVLVELYEQLVRRLAWVLLVGGCVGLWFAIRAKSSAVTILLYGGALIGLALAIRAINSRYPCVARYALVVWLLAGLLVTMMLFDDTWIPFLGVVLAFVYGFLITWGELIPVGAILAAALLLNEFAGRGYLPFGLFLSLFLGLLATILIRQTLYTALHWYGYMQKEASKLLEEARANRAELKQTLKSLEIAYDNQHRLQQNLIWAREQAEQARRLKERFAANISHELRTPLSIILGFSELMYFSPETYGNATWPVLLTRDIYQIYRSSRHLLEMIDDILHLSQLEMTEFTLHFEDTPLEPFLRDALEIAAPLFRGSPVRLELALETPLPSVQMDRTRIRQVLLNLISNARRFTERGYVQLSAAQVGDDIAIRVRDTGQGIAAEQLAHIFDEFYQADFSLNRKHGGAGLGLAISRQFVEAHGGRIWAESVEGAGSTFTFTLPPRYSRVAHYADAERPAEPPLSPARPCILVVEPDPKAAALIGRALDGYEIVRVNSLDEAAVAERLDKPSAIVCNVRPDRQPDESVLASSTAPSILCSIPSLSWVVDEYRLTACLSKPITVEDVTREVQQLENVREVLVVGEERGMVQFLERALQSAIPTVQTRHTCNGDDALAELHRRRIDLVFVDLSTNQPDALDLLRQKCADPQLAGVATIVVTATEFSLNLLQERPGWIQVWRPGGLYPVQVQRCLRGIVQGLVPHESQREARRRFPA